MNRQFERNQHLAKIYNSRPELTARPMMPVAPRSMLFSNVSGAAAAKAQLANKAKARVPLKSEEGKYIMGLRKEYVVDACIILPTLVFLT